MTAHFNLVDEPWIPCLGLDGQRRMCGIEEALISAHKSRSRFDQSPLATPSPPPLTVESWPLAVLLAPPLTVE